MRPDLIILNKWVKDETYRLYRELEMLEDLNYSSFFSALERKLLGFFEEQQLQLMHKGRKANVFPSTLFWGTQVDGESSELYSRKGEIELFFENQKVGSIFIEFSMRRGSIELANEPKISVVREG